VRVCVVAVTGTGGQDQRFGCDFGTFFSCVDGATPGELLKRGIYSEIAVALKGGPWREASITMLAMAFGMSKDQSEAWAAGKDIAEATMQRSLEAIKRRFKSSRTSTSSGLPPSDAEDVEAARARC
jgi:hypothetical protein